MECRIVQQFDILVSSFSLIIYSIYRIIAWIKLMKGEYYMASYVMSDIHGNLNALESIFQQINFTLDDNLYILGDVIDRQNHGIYILQNLMRMRNVHMILGNHEYMMLQAIDPTFDNPVWEAMDEYAKKKSWYDMITIWYENGGLETHKNFIMLNVYEQKFIIEFLKHLPTERLIIVNEQKFILCHACPSFAYDQAIDIFPHLGYKSKIDFAVWDRKIIYNFAVSKSDIITVAGHTPTPSIIPLENNERAQVYHNGNLYIMDCGAAYDKKQEDPFRLACIRLDDMQTFYSCK